MSAILIPAAFALQAAPPPEEVREDTPPPVPY